ncbi:hypothetical protein [Colwellia ponticola]|uniref:Uncharacterized protein n=1 Tax=Colwellia ponticola TaxID=2304625 RepID=A0A8H2JQL7_9GAMM|nr:hypothetical protein [Colwellia ponticola]TMM47051.1 hypothetical protein FCS21_04635 [Colwellia ponticola]
MTIPLFLENTEFEDKLAINNFFSDLTFKVYKESFKHSNYQKSQNARTIASKYKNNIAHSIGLVLSDNKHPQCFDEDAWLTILDEERNGPMMMSETFSNCLYSLIEKYTYKLTIEIKTLLWLFADDSIDEIYDVPDELGQDIDDLNVLAFAKAHGMCYWSIGNSIYNEIYLIAEEENRVNDEYTYDE